MNQKVCKLLNSIWIYTEFLAIHTSDILYHSVQSQYPKKSNSERAQQYLIRIVQILLPTHTTHLQVFFIFYLVCSPIKKNYRF